MLNNKTPSCKRLVTVKMMPEYYPAFTESSIRWLIFHEFRNGFHECVRRIGRKILIDLDDFETWMEKQTPNPSEYSRLRW